MNTSQQRIANFASVSFPNDSEHVTSLDVANATTLWMRTGKLLSSAEARTVASWWMTPHPGDSFALMAHGHSFDAFEAIDSIRREIANNTELGVGDTLDLSALAAAIIGLMAAKVQGSSDGDN